MHVRSGPSFKWRDQPVGRDGASRWRDQSLLFEMNLCRSRPRQVSAAAAGSICSRRPGVGRAQSDRHLTRVAAAPSAWTPMNSRIRCTSCLRYELEKKSSKIAAGGGFAGGLECTSTAVEYTPTNDVRGCLQDITGGRAFPVISVIRAGRRHRGPAQRAMRAGGLRSMKKSPRRQFAGVMIAARQCARVGARLPFRNS